MCRKARLGEWHSLVVFEVNCPTRRARSPGTVWKSRWPLWAPVPNKPTVSVDVKQHLLTTKSRAQARSRGGRWSWTLTKSWTVICGSRRDQGEGGELDSHLELDDHLRVRGEIQRREVRWTLKKKLNCHLRVQARWRVGRWCLDPQQSPERSKAGR